MTLNTAIDYTEMGKLIDLLTDNNIPFEMGYCYDGLQVFYPNIANRVCDAICHSGSYGHEVGLLEIMGLVDDDIDDDVQGYLSGEQVFRKMKAHYDAKSISTSGGWYS